MTRRAADTSDSGAGRVSREVRRKLEDEFRLRLTPDRWHLVERYLTLLRRWRKPAGLTAVRKTEEQLRLHFFESFWVAERFLEGSERLVDVGSGAGFPGLPFAIHHPQLQVTLLEPNLRKSVFLRTVIRELGLTAEVFRLRGEDYPKWAQAELAVMRALKPPPRLLALLSRHGIAILLLHGRLEEPLSRLHAIRSEKIPGSRGRFAGLFTPQHLAG